MVFTAAAGHGVETPAVGDTGAALVKRVAECKPRLDCHRAVGGGVTDASAAVDAPSGQTIPSGIVPAAVAVYVDTRYPGVGINEISRDARGYEVDLVDGTDLLFDPAGNFIGLDR